MDGVNGSIAAINGGTKVNGHVALNGKVVDNEVHNGQQQQQQQQHGVVQPVPTLRAKHLNRLLQNHKQYGSSYEVEEDYDEVELPEKLDIIADIAGVYRGLLSSIGEDVTRQGLRKTPERAAKALWYFTKGYRQNIQGEQPVFFFLLYVRRQKVFHQVQSECSYCHDVQVVLYHLRDVYQLFRDILN